MTHFETRLTELGAVRRVRQRTSMRQLRERRAERGFDPPAWAQEAVWNARRRAKMRNLPISIDATWIEARLRAIGYRCEISGVLFCTDNPSAAHKRPFMPSLDRIDCRRGYVRGNVRIVCVAVNMLLQDWGDEVYSRITSACAHRTAT